MDLFNINIYSFFYFKGDFMTFNSLDILNVLDELGLNITANTGGCLYDIAAKVVNGHSIDVDYIRCDDDVNIKLLDGKLFLKSLREAEDAFNIQFFVSA